MQTKNYYQLSEFSSIGGNLLLLSFPKIENLVKTTLELRTHSLFTSFCLPLQLAEFLEKIGKGGSQILQL
jgi:hypothetical protein